MSELVRLLLSSSEKAANIARRIRSETKLFNLLIEEKTGEQKNDRFIQDFKTLADVLIQESLRHDIASKFPDMKDNIYGEESNTFTNALGATITVKIEDTPELTACLLSQVLDGDEDAAKLLAEEVHREIELNESETSSLPHDLIDSFADIGIWIDPIDATNEYIKGSEQFDKMCHENFEEEDQVWSAGLHTVTVLIGAFDMSTGLPLVGVINQPFWKYDALKGRWNGRFFWGLCMKDTCVSTLTRFPLSSTHQDNFPKRRTVILSSSEDKITISKLRTKFNTISSSGAGYKLLCVALGVCDSYILTKDSVHLWDLCGPHSILNSLGGGVVNFTNYCCEDSNSSPGKNIRLSYDPNQVGGKEDNFVVKGGILAFRDVQTATAIKECILSAVVDPTPLTSPTCDVPELLSPSLDE